MIHKMSLDASAAKTIGIFPNPRDSERHWERHQERHQGRLGACVGVYIGAAQSPTRQEITKREVGKDRYPEY